MKKHIKLFEQYSNNHNRVIPRDFFNEAKLLKCMGVLSLAILDGNVPDGIKIKIEENGQPFDIELDGMWGMLTVSNYRVSVNGEHYTFGTTYNSKENFPFYVIVDDLEIEVFDNAGNFSQDFIRRFS